MHPEFWRGKRVLITGHTGFKGSWLALWLQKHGARVTGYSLPAPTVPSLFEDARVADGMTSIHGDVRDLGALRRTIADAAPDIVFHMAAQALVLESYRAPVTTYATNVMGTVHLLEAVRTTPSIRVAINVTSDKCYENREWVWPYREDEPMGGADPYSNSKGCSELVTSAYRRSFFGTDGSRAVIASGRAGNVIGGGDWATDRLVPDLMRAFSEGRPARIRRPRAIRPWQHVLEPLSGYVHLAERLWEAGDSLAEGWNFGPNDAESRPVSWIVEQLAASWGEGARWETDAGPHPHEAHYLRLDCSKARTLLGWSPRLSLETTLQWTAEWYRSRAGKGDVRALTLDQISRYEANQ
jgi:CDP-glucose 4,6-dehydratase